MVTVSGTPIAANLAEWVDADTIEDTGIATSNVPLLNAANTFTAAQTISTSSAVGLTVVRPGANAQMGLSDGTNTFNFLMRSGATQCGFSSSVANFKFGIGTTIPSAKLHVINSDASYPAIKIEAGTTASIGLIVDAAVSPTADIQQWQVNGSTLAGVDKDGHFYGPDNFASNNVALLDQENTFTGGDQNIFPASGDVRLRLKGVEGTNRTLLFHTEDSARWWFGCTSVLESGGDVGSDFRIYRYSDAGTNIGTPLTLRRSTGRVGINDTNPGAQLDINADTVSTVGLIVNAMAGATADIQRWQVNGSTLAGVDKDGHFYGPDNFASNNVALLDQQNTWTQTQTVNGQLLMTSTNASINQIVVTNTSSGASARAGVQIVGDGVSGTLTARSDSSTYVPGDFQIASSGGNIAFNAGNSTTADMFVFEDGKVAINNTSPSAQLHVNAKGASTVGLIVNAASGATVDTQRWTYDGANRSRMIAKSGENGLFFYSYDAGSDNVGPLVQLGRNNNATGAPGSLSLVPNAGSGTRYYYVYSGDLYSYSSRPTDSNEASGSPVGTETSHWKFKDVIGPGISAAESLDYLRDAASTIRKFVYKNGDEQEYEGIILSGDNLHRYGKAPDENHAAGKVLNEVNIFGDLMKVVAMQADQIEQLTVRITELEKN